MKKVEVFLMLLVPEAAKEQFDEVILSQLKNESGIDHVMVIQENQDGETSINFTYDAGIPALEHVLQVLSLAGCTIKREYIHLPSDISGMSSIYDSRDMGAAVSTALKVVDGVVDVVVGSNGRIKLAIDPSKNQSRLVATTLEVLNKLRS